MGRHTESQDLVLKAEVLELSCMMTTMAIKDQESPLSIRKLSVLMEVLNPLESKSVVCLAIVTHSNLPGSRKASLVPFCLMSLYSKDDKWWDSPALCINSLNSCNPLSVPWLNCPCSSLPVRAYDHF